MWSRLIKGYLKNVFDIYESLKFAMPRSFNCQWCTNNLHRTSGVNIFLAFVCVKTCLSCTSRAYTEVHIDNNAYIPSEHTEVKLLVRYNTNLHAGFCDPVKANLASAISWIILNPLLDFFFFFLVYQADVSIFYTSNLYWWGKGWPVDGLPFPDTGCPVPDVSIYYMFNINELPDGILFHWFCKCTPPWMFLPLDIPSEYRPEHVTFGLLCVIFKFPSRIFCRRVPGFATDCPCGVWCRGLTTCLLYVGPPLEF